MPRIAVAARGTCDLLAELASNVAIAVGANGGLAKHRPSEVMFGAKANAALSRCQGALCGFEAWRAATDKTIPGAQELIRDNANSAATTLDGAGRRRVGAAVLSPGRESCFLTGATTRARRGPRDRAQLVPMIDDRSSGSGP